MALSLRFLLVGNASILWRMTVAAGSTAHAARKRALSYIRLKKGLPYNSMRLI